MFGIKKIRKELSSLRECLDLLKSSHNGLICNFNEHRNNVRRDYVDIETYNKLLKELKLKPKYESINHLTDSVYCELKHTGYEKIKKCKTCRKEIK